MTPEQLKTLAIFAAEFLGYTKLSNYPNLQWFNSKRNYPVDYLSDECLAEDFFDNWSLTPILAHLAKLEIEAKEWHWYESYKYDRQEKNKIYFFQIIKDSDRDVKFFVNENNFIALWSAIEQTGEK